MFRIQRTGNVGSIIFEKFRLRVGVTAAWLTAIVALAGAPTPNQAGNAHSIVATLAAIEAPNGRLSAPATATLQRHLAALAALGTNALPAIRDFLQRNQDVYFDAPEGANFAVAPSLRVALLEVAGNVPGPDTLALLKNAFQATADPTELATLAKLLDHLEPGKHRADCLRAARETLALAGSSGWDGRDVAPVFEMLREFGGAGVAPELPNYANPWFHYAALTALQLPGETGVPVLIQLAKSNDPRHAVGRDAALRALSQAAVRNSQAADELLLLARSNKISVALWPRVSATLAGNTLHFARPVLQPLPPLVKRTNTRSLRLAVGNQNLLEVAPPDDIPAQEIGDRIRLVDRLLEASTNPSAIDSLEAARIQLAQRLKPKK